MDEGKNIEIDPDWFKKNKIRGFSQRLERHIEKEMAELEKLLRDYLIAMLDLCHRRLLRGKISLSEYYRTTQMLAYCGERVNKVCEEI
jgi:hypothetical protein